MADEQDDSQKTEEPSQKRLQDAVERGQVVTSREITSFLLLAAFTVVLGESAPDMLRKAQGALSAFIERPESIPINPEALGLTLEGTLKILAGTLAIPFIAFVVSILFANAVQNRFVFSLEPIVPKLEKISLMKGIERLFSLRALTEFLKGIIKIVIVSVVAYYMISPYFRQLRELPDIAIGGTLAYLFMAAKRMMIGICVVMFFVALFDYLYQRYEYMKGLRMSKQEQRDEYKQQEGDPKVKQRLRQVRMERAKKRMMAAVPTADVIVTNPTHYSIALKYEAGAMRAPMVVAKGMDLIALRMREVAREHNIPIYENKPLAQALYATVEVDHEVPAEHYKAVAEVISYVYRLRGRKG